MCVQEVWLRATGDKTLCYVTFSFCNTFYIARTSFIVFCNDKTNHRPLLSFIRCSPFHGASVVRDKSSTKVEMLSWKYADTSA